MISLLRSSQSPLARQQNIDALCLAGLVVLLAAPFLTRLGFYSDDWWILAAFQKDLLNGQFGLRTFYTGFEPRPLQGLYLGTLYLLFRLDPLGYHLVNTAVLAGAVVALYRLLVRMRIGRGLAFASAAIFIVLPQLSTARVWYSTFQIPIGLLFAFLALHAQLNFTKTGKALWVVTATLFALVSVASYEIFAPLIGGFPVWLLYDRWRSDSREPGRREMQLTAVMMATLALAVIVKGIVTDRAQRPDMAMYMKGLARLVDPAYDWRAEGSLNIFATVEVNLWQPFAGMVRGGGAMLRGELGLPAMLIGIAVGAVVAWRLWPNEKVEEERGGAIRLLAIGFGAFLLGHMTFLITSQIMFSPTGIGNRALVAIAIGVALLFAAVAALATNGLGSQRGRSVFAAIVALIAVAGSWRVEQVYLYWAESWTIEQQLFASAKADLKGLPPKSTIIFDGVCPYHGPGIVMETVEAADFLYLALGYPMLADTSADRMTVTPEGLRTWIYGDRYLYPYGDRLFVYDPDKHSVERLTDYRSALTYFSNSTGIRKCPQGYVGQGVLI